VNFGLVLAGGQSRRMGRDKAYLEFEGETLIERTIQRIQPQVDVLGLSTGPNRDRLSEITLPRIFDLEPSEAPICGILAGLAWARASGGMSARLITVPIDCPHIPFDLVRKLNLATDEIVFGSSHGRHHPVVGSWPAHSLEVLLDAFHRGERKIDRLAEQVGWSAVDWPIDPKDPFYNVNTPEEFTALTPSAS
jgi:molybdenum cofactor guanylyltransferase